MNHALVLACGNPLRGDDGIAVVLARYFRAEFCEPETDIRSSQQWTPELAEPISQSDIVLFVDASAMLPPGKIQFKIVEPVQEFSASMTHTIGPEALLVLSVQLSIPASPNAPTSPSAASLSITLTFRSRYARQIPLPWI
jgi:hydrogenase maturation protease